MTTTLKNATKDILKAATLTAVAVAAALTLASCGTSRTTTTATARTEASTEVTLGMTRTVDSVIVRETVFIRERPDTVTVWRDRTHWRTRTVHDTVIVRTTDTVVRTERVEVEKETFPPPLLGGGESNRTPGWAWGLLGALAFGVIMQIIGVKHRLNKD